MKRFSVALMALGLGAAQPAVWAQEPDGVEEVVADAAAGDEGKDGGADDEMKRVTYSGIGLSRLSTGFENVKDAVSLDAAMGFRIPDVQWFGVELNLSATVIPGQVKQTSSTGGGEDCPFDPLPIGCTDQPGSTSSSEEDFQALSFGVFGVVRTPGKLYGMGKIGYRYMNTNLPELEEDRSGSAWGAGLGYRYSAAGGFAELQYTKLSDDLELLGFSLGYGFGGK